MEILFISHKYPPGIGGMEKQCFELITQAEKNHVIHKIVHNAEQESKLVFFIKLKTRTKNILKKFPAISIIHLNDGLMGMFTLWLKKYTTIPVILTFHGLDLVFPNRFYQAFIAKKYHRYDAAICVSSATAKECIKRNFEPQKVFVVPNGVDQEIAKYTNSPQQFITDFNQKYNTDISHKKIIALLGRPVQRKGFSWFLEKVLPQLNDEVMVIMVGPFSDTAKTPLWKKLLGKKLADQVELAQGGLSDERKISGLLKNPVIQKKVIQTGKLPFHEVLEVLSLASLFVMPNVKKEGDAEGFGLVALEASLRKAVVLASDLEGIPEAIQDGKNGYLLPSEDREIWIEKIKSMLQDSQKLKVTGEAFQKYTLDHYSWEKMAEGYLEVFRKVIN